jgi:hypothetical protein
MRAPGVCAPRRQARARKGPGQPRGARAGPRLAAAPPQGAACAGRRAPPAPQPLGAQYVTSGGGSPLRRGPRPRSPPVVKRHQPARARRRRRCEQEPSAPGRREGGGGRRSLVLGRGGGGRGLLGREARHRLVHLGAHGGVMALWGGPPGRGWWLGCSQGGRVGGRPTSVSRQLPPSRRPLLCAKGNKTRQRRVRTGAGRIISHSPWASQPPSFEFRTEPPGTKGSSPPAPPQSAWGQGWWGAARAHRRGCGQC